LFAISRSLLRPGTALLKLEAGQVGASRPEDIGFVTTIDSA
jgi:hypothetical protein